MRACNEASGTTAHEDVPLKSVYVRAQVIPCQELDVLVQVVQRERH